MSFLTKAAQLEKTPQRKTNATQQLCLLSPLFCSAPSHPVSLFSTSADLSKCEEGEARRSFAVFGLKKVWERSETGRLRVKDFSKLT